MKLVKHIGAAAFFASLFCHMVGIGIMDEYYTREKVPPKIVVQLKIAKKVEVPVKEEPPPKPEKKIPKKPKPKQVPEQKLVSGLSKKSLSDQETTFKAALGNTLLTEDKGLRLNDVTQVDIDMREEAKIISAPIPEYTPQAEDAELVGQYEVDVYIDELGNVTQAEPATKIGFGMDDRVIKAALKAKYHPRKNRFGKAIAGWSKLVFVLKLD